jgi:hypothetical protein
MAKVGVIAALRKDRVARIEVAGGLIRVAVRIDAEKSIIQSFIAQEVESKEKKAERSVVFTV